MQIFSKGRRFLRAKINTQRFKRQPLDTLCVGKRILVIAPHPDDELLFNYGILNDQTFDVSVALICSRGKNYTERLTEFVRCLDLLDRPYYILDNYRDGDGSAAKILQFLKRLGSGYDVVVSPVSLNTHVDHAACASACSQYVRHRNDVIWLSYVDIFTMGYGNFFYDLTAVHDRKVSTFRECYISQSDDREFDFEREMISRDYISGTYYGVKFAESYLREL